MTDAAEKKSLFTFEFLALCLVIVTAFANVSVFYSFYYYLGAIDIPVVWRGFLVGLEPMAAFGLRLLILPWLHVRNSYAISLFSLILLIAVSCGYLCVTSVSGLIVLRIAHGAVFVLLTSAVISLLVNFIPPQQSGRGFSALAVAAMIPYAVVPPLTETILPFVRNAADIYAGVSIFSLAGIVLMLVVRRRIHSAIGRMDKTLMQRLSLVEIRDNFRQKPVVLLLAAILFVYMAHATVFYFIKNLTCQTGVGNAGIYFSVAMAAMIAVRLFGSFVFDRFDKLKLLPPVLAALVISLAILPHAATPLAFYAMAAVYGACIGVSLPVFNALIFSASAPGLRGLNTNMTLFAMDAGYFLTPYLGGALIAGGAGFNILFYAAAGFVLFCLALIKICQRREENDEN
ncbi:MAG: MFS transporter [Smithellaceae bacterium]|nr:MFS transporter [Smithellaceae bacterium]